MFKTPRKHLPLAVGTHLFKHNWFFFPDRIHSISLGCLGFKSLSPCVHRQTKHIHLHVSPNLLIRKKLAWNNLEKSRKSWQTSNKELGESSKEARCSLQVWNPKLNEIKARVEPTFLSHLTSRQRRLRMGMLEANQMESYGNNWLTSILGCHEVIMTSDLTQLAICRIVGLLCPATELINVP